MKLKEHLSGFIRPMRISSKMVQVALSVTTAFTAFVTSFPFFAKFIPIHIAIPLGIGVAYLLSYAIDGTLDKLLPYAFTGWELQNRRERLLIHIIRIATVILLAATTTVTWYGLPEISEVTTTEVDIADATRTIRTMRQDNARFRTEQEMMIASYVASVAAATRDGDAMVNTAIDANPAAAKLWRSKNQWVRTDTGLSGYRKRIAQAQRARAQMIAQAQAKLDSVRRENTRTIQQNTAMADSSIAKIAMLTERQQEARSQRVKSKNTILTIIDFVLAGVLVLNSLMLGFAQGFQFKQNERSAPEVLFTIMDANTQKLYDRALRTFVPGDSVELEIGRTFADASEGTKPVPSESFTVPVPVRGAGQIDDVASALLALQKQVASLGAPETKTIVKEGKLDKTCLRCQKPFLATTVRAKFCCDDCRKRYHEGK